MKKTNTIRLTSPQILELAAQGKLAPIEGRTVQPTDFTVIIEDEHGNELHYIYTPGKHKE